MPDLKQEFQTALGRVSHKNAAATCCEFTSADEIAGACTDQVGEEKNGVASAVPGAPSAEGTQSCAPTAADQTVALGVGGRWSSSAISFVRGLQGPQVGRVQNCPGGGGAEHLFFGRWVAQLACAAQSTLLLLSLEESLAGGACANRVTPDLAELETTPWRAA